MAGASVPGRQRALYAGAAAIAGVVTIVFATIGDGVEVPEASGLRAFIVDVGHVLVWALLTVAFAAAAVVGRWGRLSQIVAVGALAVYALFLVAVLLWP